MKIRLLEDADWPAAWQIIERVFRAGETYAFPTDITENEARRVWDELPLATFVAVDDENKIVGTYYLKANQLGPGSHVCNCGYLVSENARGKGVASAMCEHSQQEAMTRGFLSMQFNLVAATNEGAVRLWKKHGFKVVGTIPEAFRHPQFGFVDAFVMFKKLTSTAKRQQNE